MRLTVRYFAALRETMGTAAEGVELDGASAAVGAVIDALRARHGEAVAALVSARVRIAVNREFVERDALLRDGDELAFLPPVTGG